MRLLNLDGRAHLHTTDGLVDIAAASAGRFPSDPQHLYAIWEDFARWSKQYESSAAALDDVDRKRLASPAPRPSQVFAVGLNYREHIAETADLTTGNDEQPLIFTKFPSCIAAPFDGLQLSGDSVDWEVELVAVIGRTAHQVRTSQAWEYIAGLTVGQDFSDRQVQLRGSPAQFSLGKSFPGFGPLGPSVVSPDELENRDALRLSCTVNGEVVQDGNTRQMVHTVGSLVAMLSEVCVLSPGDVVFTGTPGGVGMARTPARYLKAGDVVESTIEGIGTMSHHCLASAGVPASDLGGAE